MGWLVRTKEINCYGVVVDMTHVTVISSKEEAEELFEEFGFMDDGLPKIDWVKFSEETGSTGIFVDFNPRVSCVEWLRGWDITSIAIWNQDAIVSVDLTETKLVNGREIMARVNQEARERMSIRRRQRRMS